MATVESLKGLGLTENESKAYLALLSVGTSTASAVAQRAGVNRSVVYAALDNLIAKGLASYAIKNNVRYFTPAPPERLASWIQEKREAAERVAEELADIAAPPAEARAEIYKGMEGIRTAIDVLLNASKDWWVIGWTGGVRGLSPVTFELYERRRVKLGVKRHVVATRDKMPALCKMPLTEARYIPKEYLSPASVSVSGDFILVFMPYRREPTIFLFESRETASAFRRYFELLWKIAKP